MSEVAVRVPASTTNLGPGFDVLGLALGLHNRIRLRETDGPVTVRVRGEGEGLLETGADNLVYRAVQRLAAEVGRPAPALALELENAIPVSRGLGSSSTAIVGGLVGANRLFGDPLDREALLRLAVEIEGHPDNVTPALLGGFQLTCLDGEELIHLSLPAPKELRAVVCIPEARVSTAEARRVLPGSYSRRDAVFNVGRASLLVAALLLDRPELLGRAMEDRIHQPYRAELVPGFAAALAAARDAGADGAALSGSGSTILSLTRTNPDMIGHAMAAAVRAAGTPARWLALDVDPDGTVVESVLPA